MRGGKGKEGEEEREGGKGERRGKRREGGERDLAPLEKIPGTATGVVTGDTRCEEKQQKMQIWVRGRSRSLKMVAIDRSCTTLLAL